jgi:cysteine desulfurase/selenocysteine lyase
MNTSNADAGFAPAASADNAFNLSALRNEFPILTQRIHGSVPLVYLDNAATTQRPISVINATTDYLLHSHSNVHRGGHALATEATRLFELTRSRIQAFINAPYSEEIIYTRGTTEAVNLVASAWGDDNVKSGDEIIVSEMDHHAVIVPMQMLCQRKGATLRVLPVLDNGTLDLDALTELINNKTKLIAVNHVSNTLGTINDVKTICALARHRGITTFIDGAQAVAHLKVDVQDIDCDFYAFSAHKLYGPTGVGALYGRAEIMSAMSPYQGGGSMIASVSFEGTTYNDLPYRFEAGTQNIEGAVGLGAALEWFIGLDHNAIAKYEQTLLQRATEGLSAIKGLRIIGNAPDKIGIVSFVVDGIHASDIGVLCDEQGVALRIGHHCTMPLMKRFGVGSTARASTGVYTTLSEIDALIKSVGKAVRMLS